MTDTQDLVKRNADFAASTFNADLQLNPYGNMMIIGCVDPRVDPAHVLGLSNGECAVIRNVGGRITPATLRTLAMLTKVAQANAASKPAGDWNLVIVHHTDCGMTDLAAFPDLLAEYFEIPAAELGAKSVSDPIGSVRVDVGVILAKLHAPAFLVSGLVYDVSTGLVETVVAPTPLRTAWARGPAMCTVSAEPGQIAAARPRAAAGSAVDPIALEPVDEVVITTVVDNVYDALLSGDERVTRAPFSAETAKAPQFESGSTTVGLMAEHGFSALVSVRRGSTTTTLLFDTGLSPDAMVTNADRLGLDLSGVQAVILSHGHFDHAGGLAGLAGKRGIRSLPMVVHPLIWTRRRMAVPGREPDELPTLSKAAVEREGFTVIERREPSLLVDRCVLITGEVDRTTEFEHGMPPAHQAWTGSEWLPDRLLLDDQALVVHLRGKGLVVLTGCGHAGVINIVRHVQRLTAVPGLHALIGGLHLSGPAFEPTIGPTVGALSDLDPALLVPGHCTGWRAQHTLAAALPQSWVAGSSGSSFRLSAA